MKAITVIQPWGSLIITGVKHIETRSWYTDIRGRIAIHAGKNNEYLLHPPKTIAPYITMNLPLGAVLGTIDLIDCVPLEKVQQEYPDLYTDKERQLGDWTSGRYGFILQSSIMLPMPIPARGHQGWWEWAGITE